MKKDYLSRRKIGAHIEVSDTPTKKNWTECIQFRRYMFEYFEEISSGQTGWGISFNDWLELAKGWKLIGWNKYKKVQVIAEI